MSLWGLLPGQQFGPLGWMVQPQAAKISVPQAYATPGTLMTGFNSAVSNFLWYSTSSTRKTFQQQISGIAMSVCRYGAQHSLLMHAPSTSLETCSLMTRTPPIPTTARGPRSMIVMKAVLTGTRRVLTTIVHMLYCTL